MSQVTPQEAIVLDRENKYLKQTIVSLRDELASKDIGLENLIQQNLAGLNSLSLFGANLVLIVK